MDGGENGVTGEGGGRKKKGGGHCLCHSPTDPVDWRRSCICVKSGASIIAGRLSGAFPAPLRPPTPR